MSVKLDPNQKNRKIAGFTLTELLVSMFVITIMAGFILVSYGQRERIYVLNQAAQRLISDLRQTQNMAIAGKTQGSVTPAGYGFYVVNPSQYKIFYNKVVDATYQSKLYNGISDNSVDLETINLPVNITFSSSGTVFFVPPEPVTYINGWNDGVKTFTIAALGNIKNVTVSYSGSIGSCIPSCTGKVCGSDGCGGSCGTCSAGLTCNASGTSCDSSCIPSCTGKVCGSDGCGGSCGTCSSGLTCNASGTSCDGSGGGVKVICSELYRQGFISEQIYQADNKYAKEYIDKETMAGYHFWAKPLVSLMKKSKLITRGVMILAIPWSEHMAYSIGEGEQDNSFGNFIDKIGVPVCRLLGNFLSVVKWGDFSTEL